MFRMLVFFLGLIASGSAVAAIDLTNVEAAFADLNTSLTTVGGLILSAILVVVAFRWVSRMIK